MLSNIYGDLGRWKDVARLKVAIRDTGLRKLPGCSLIEVNDDVVEFYSLDERHPKQEEIYGALRGILAISHYPETEDSNSSWSSLDRALLTVLLYSSLHRGNEPLLELSKGLHDSILEPTSIFSIDVVIDL
ncbi:hypothetical protein FNV43_RR26615 [Rhamnella rubrinervis]|uniref:Uncharacterized protein n=1 Tax=Rhamnella rubrinervis TaxID=2594499 RepID=A0A8K0DPF6_9ROSA|nr:hypothetical protein FNV43_RR26615 [Rhamnella rubrinervis]